MRIHLHDGSGHPFQVQLSRALARRGHNVLHTYSTQFLSGRGRLAVGDDDPAGLRIEGITASREMIKYSPVARTRWEMSYGKAWQAVLERSPCDVVVSCNTQLFVAASMRRYFHRRGLPWILWHQDIASLAIADEAARRLPPAAARAVRGGVQRMERNLIRDSSAVVAIGTPFVEQYRRWHCSTSHVRVIPNWAPLDEIVPADRDNPWARAHGLPASGMRLLYAGTLGRKHNPQLLLDLVDGYRSTGGDGQLTVVSEGAGADELAAAARSRPYLRVLPYQPAEHLAETLASADVLVALLEPEASQFSVPSKVLSYLAAGRPVLALAPASNPCARDVIAGGGRIVEPSAEGVREAALWIAALAADRARWTGVCHQARHFAEGKFDVERVADSFEELLRAVTSPSGLSAAPTKAPAYRADRALL